MRTRIWAFLDWCFFGPASVRAGMLGGSLRVLRYPYAVVRDLWRGEINLRAMSLVYTTLLSIIPLLAFSFAILKVFGGHRDLEPIVYPGAEHNFDDPGKTGQSNPANRQATGSDARGRELFQNTFLCRWVASKTLAH